MRDETPYPTLAALFGGWFHQDFDLAGPTLPDIVRRYRASASVAEQGRLRREIVDFLQAHAADVGAALDAHFELEVDPLGFAPSAEAFLRAILEALGPAGAPGA